MEANIHFLRKEFIKLASKDFGRDMRISHAENPNTQEYIPELDTVMALVSFSTFLGKNMMPDPIWDEIVGMVGASLHKFMCNEEALKHWITKLKK